MSRCGILFIFLLAVVCQACNQSKSGEKVEGAALIHRLNLALMEAIVQDGFSPPVASRIYAYPNIAAYEAVVSMEADLKSYQRQLRGLDTLPTPPAAGQYIPEVVMIQAFCDVAVAMVYRDHIIEAERNELLEGFQTEQHSAHLAASLEYGKKLGEAIIRWANGDGYPETRNFPKYTVTDTPGAWLPTPPKYMEALEPHWAKVRPFVLDSNNMFRKPLWYEFSTDTNALLWKQAQETYLIVKNINAENHAISKYWDCNPSPSDIQGHVMTTNRQNTPGGHWLGIARIAAKQRALSLPQTCEIISKTAIAIADAFKVIWDTKYAWANIRPETYIAKYVDPEWRPLLETPNFPEFSSGHSGISAAAAYVLTQRFGNDFAFTDSTNVPFGFPPRQFTSFNEAAQEAAVSRVYGGIHFMKSCNIAAEQGRSVARILMMHVRTGNDFTAQAE